MTHAPHFPAGMMHVQLSAAVLDDGRFVASASSAHSRIAAIVAGSSIATTVSLSPDTPCCSSAPSDALVETPFRIPSTDTLGFAAAALAASCLACYPVVDSVDELLDLDQGSWEGSLPDSSSLGEDGTPLRGAFIIDSASLTGFQELTAGKTLSILREWRILIAIDLRQPGPLWSAKLAQSYAAADIPDFVQVLQTHECFLNHIPEFRVTIREMKEKPYPPPPETPLSCVYQKTLSLILLSTTAHNRALSDSVRQQFFASSSARVVHRRPFCNDGPV